ncbi:hypothetical protein ACLMJK_004810 [Lecanora helva]
MTSNMTTVQDNLCATIVETFTVMVELRMKADYGGHLGITFPAPPIDQMDTIRKINELDWYAIGTNIRAEEDAAKEQEARGHPRSSTPYLDAITKAAAELGWDEDLVKYQILAYADCVNKP